MCESTNPVYLSSPNTQYERTQNLKKYFNVRCATKLELNTNITELKSPRTLFLTNFYTKTAQPRTKNF